jgi:radical SAM superfamily enzyme with C-terminal helix-hairpin-helix motif
VPPYISPYPRYIAGAIWTYSPQTEIRYQTIDQVRLSVDDSKSLWSKSDMLILIAGMIVPGKYVGGTPISVREARAFFSESTIGNIPKLLVGPWARFGCGLQGGKLALSSEVLSPPFDYIVTGDPEIVISEAAQANWNLDKVNIAAIRANEQEIEQYVRKGSRIVQQHPGFNSRYIICEIETYRGCPRFLTGGCSFCVEPLYGTPSQRHVDDIVNEIGLLYNEGVQAFRIGRQADLFTYGSNEMGIHEFPQPNPQVIEQLFSKIRKAAPSLEVLHIDNVNPGTIARHPEESKSIAKSIIKYHTTGDVAAFGIESLDPEVMKRNNLKVTEEGALEAIRILNEVGGQRPPWELPHLLPGINLVYGLPGERKETLEYNMAFLEQILAEGLIVRRINIRQVIGFPKTRVSKMKGKRIKHHEFIRHKQQVREDIDLEMIKRVAPPGTIIHNAHFEYQEGNICVLRSLGTYPLLCYTPVGHEPFTITDVTVIDHGPRSVSVLPYPFLANNATLSQWKRIPGIGAKRAAGLKSAAQLSNTTEIEKILEMELPFWFSRTLKFENE